MKKFLKGFLWPVAIILFGLALYAIKEKIFIEPKIVGFYVEWDKKSLVSLKANIKKMDQIVPVWIHLSDSDGSIIVTDQKNRDKVSEFINRQKPGVLITPLVNNFNLKTQNWDGEMLAKMLKDPMARSCNAQALLNLVQSMGIWCCLCGSFMVSFTRLDSK